MFGVKACPTSMCDEVIFVDGQIRGRVTALLSVVVSSYPSGGKVSVVMFHFLFFSSWACLNSSSASGFSFVSGIGLRRRGESAGLSDEELQPSRDELNVARQQAAMQMLQESVWVVAKSILCETVHCTTS